MHAKTLLPQSVRKSKLRWSEKYRVFTMSETWAQAAAAVDETCPCVCVWLCVMWDEGGLTHSIKCKHRRIIYEFDIKSTDFEQWIAGAVACSVLFCSVRSFDGMSFDINLSIFRALRFVWISWRIYLFNTFSSCDSRVLALNMYIGFGFPHHRRRCRHRCRCCPFFSHILHKISWTCLLARLFVCLFIYLLFGAML